MTGESKVDYFTNLNRVFSSRAQLKGHILFINCLFADFTTTTYSYIIYIDSLDLWFLIKRTIFRKLICKNIKSYTADGTAYVTKCSSANNGSVFFGDIHHPNGGQSLGLIRTVMTSPLLRLIQPLLWRVPNLTVLGTAFARAMLMEKSISTSQQQHLRTPRN